MKNKISKLLLIFTIFILSFKVNALTTLIELKDKLVVTTDTTIEDITKVLGTPKVKTISPFGGYAYTFYTDDNYSNYLYIETTDEDKIISYGSVSKNYSVPAKNTNGETLIEDINDLSGYFYTDDNNKIIGGIYYNPSVLENLDTEEIIHLYNTNYDKYTTEYQSGMARHIVPMYNALAKRLSKNINLQHSDAFEYYYNNFNASKNLNFEVLEEKDLAFAKLTTCVLNPLHFASMIKENLEKDYSKNNIALFGYDKTAKKIYGYVTDYKKADDAGYFYKNNYNYGSYFDLGSIYALNLLDDKMTETEKALILAQFTQYGKLLNSNVSTGTKENVMSSSWYNDYFQTLATSAGLSCETIKKDGNSWIICNLDDEWTYIDVTKSDMNTFEPYPYAKIKFNLFFKGKKTIESNSKLNSIYGFKDKFTLYATNSHAEDASKFPEGVDKQIDDYASMVYYDNDYKYYEKSENKKTYIYKENRTSHEVEKLQEALYHINGTGLVKDNDNLYYVGTDESLYSYNLDNKSNTKIASVEDNKTIASVYIDAKGIISYLIYDDENQKNEIGKTNIRLESWPREKIYYFDDNNYKYKYLYLETPENITIGDVIPFGYNSNDYSSNDKVSGTLNIPDKINNKPVVGIAPYTFSSLNLKGKLILPEYLEYIGNRAFSGMGYMEGIEINSKLKSIGKEAFYDSNINDILNFPESLSYIGGGAFFFAESIKGVSLSSNLKYLNYEVFPYVYRLNKIIIPEGIEYIASSALPEANAYILPKSLINIAEDNRAKELFLKSQDTIYDKSYYDNNYRYVYYVGSDFKDIVKLNLEYGSSTSWEYNLKHGPFKLYYNIKPKYYFDETVLTWSSTNPNVAKVDNEGNVTLVGKGDVTIKLTSSNGGVGTFDLKVIGLNLNYEKFQFTSLNQTLELKATDSKNNQKAYDVTWESSNPDIAMVDSYGRVTPKKAGTVKITATSSSYGTAECTISVNLPIDLGDGTLGYFGDLDGDNKIEVSDAVDALKCYIEAKETTDRILKVADFNGNNKIDVSDAVEILKLYVNK